MDLIGPKWTKLTVSGIKYFWKSYQGQAPLLLEELSRGFGVPYRIERGESLVIGKANGGNELLAECSWEGDEGEELEWTIGHHASSTCGSGLSKFWRGVEAEAEGFEEDFHSVFPRV